ncbi:hypothetical protein HBH75_040690 [Parastagonospora nodorum]|nr:hypothetical protein HBH75_040690 [Parastagonospora nodorum]
MLNLASLLRLLIGNLLGNADCINNNNNNIAPTLQFSLTALLNPQLLALKRPALSSSDLNCRRTNPTIATLLAKRIKTNKDRKKSTHRNNNNVQLVGDNIEELIYVSKVKNNHNNLNIIVTNPTSREFSRVDIKSLTRLYLLIDRAKANVANIFNTVISKLDEVPTRELSSYIKIELYLHQKQALRLRDNSRKFYRLIITSEDTHYKQTIKKAYIILLERALLILFIT